MAGKPLWRRAYDSVERPVGSRLENAVQTDLFADVAGLVVRGRAGLSRRVERTTRHALHRANLPAASDVARLREQVSSLERSVRRLDDALRREQAPQGAARVQRATAATKRTAAQNRKAPAARPAGPGRSPASATARTATEGGAHGAHD